MLFRMGSLRVGVRVQSELGWLVLDELSAGLAPATGSPNLVLNFVETLPDRHGQLNGNVLLSNGEVRLTYRDLICDVRQADGPLELHIASASQAGRSAFQETIARCRHPAHLSPAEALAKCFVSEIFTWASQISQTNRGQSYIHAATMRRGDATLAVMGWRGIGKTTTQMALCGGDGWEYISDDLAIVDRCGRLFRSPQKVQLFGFNLSANPTIKRRAFAKRGIFDRLSALQKERRFGAAHVRRHVAAEDLFSAMSPTESACLTDILYIERSTRERHSWSAMDFAELARRMAIITVTEMGPYQYFHQQAAIAGGRLLKSPAELENEARDVLSSAFAGRRVAVLYLPRDIRYPEIVEAVRQFTERPTLKLCGSHR